MKLLLLTFIGFSCFAITIFLGATKEKYRRSQSLFRTSGSSHQSNYGRRELIQTTNSSGSSATRANSKLKGTIPVDFYRTFEEKSCLGMTWKQYSIPKWRLRLQIVYLNVWFGGRVEFVQGEFYEVTDEYYYSNPDLFCETALEYFSFFSDEVQNPDHVSVLAVKRLAQGYYGCATINVPLGGFPNDSIFSLSPAIILGMSNDNLGSSNSRLGLAAAAGALLAHEMGHVVGYLHTVGGNNEGIQTYQDCGLNIRYPYFSNAFPSSTKNNVVWDPVTGERYSHSDWQGRTNVMSSLSPYIFLQPWQFGIFKKDYGPLFDTILECFFLRSATNAEL